MDSNGQLIQLFYDAFSRRDYLTMQQCYHKDATFYDPVFQTLNADEVKAMWEMLLKAGDDLEITFRDIRSGDNTALCHWEARYSFSLTGKKVHNIIEAEFEFRDNKIIKHRDRFGLWRWSRQAFGVAGFVLGWTSFMRNKIRAKARARLDLFISKVQSY